MKERTATTEEATAMAAELQSTAKRLNEIERQERRRAQAIASGALSPANGIERYLANKARQLEESYAAYQVKRDEVWSLEKYIEQLEATIERQNFELARLGYREEELYQ